MDAKEQYRSLVKKDRKKIIILSLLSLLTSVVVVLFAWLSKKFIDNIQTDNFTLYLVLLILAAVIEVVLKTFSSYLTNRYQIDDEIKLRKDFFKKVMGSDYATVRDNTNAELLTLLNSDTRIVSRGVISIIPQSINLISRIVLSIALLFFFDWQFALIFLGCGALVTILTSLLRKKNKELHLLLQKEESHLLNFYTQGLNSLLSLKVYGLTSSVTAKEDSVNASEKKATLKQKDFNLVINSGLLLLVRLTYVLAIIYCVYKLKDNPSYLGTLFGIVELVEEASGPFMSLSAITPAYYQTIGSLDRLMKLSNAPSEKHLTGVTDFNSMEVRNLSYTYPDGKSVLTDVSFTLMANQFISLCGESGGGKSTLLKILLGVYKPTSGEILVNNTDTNGSLNPLFGYVPQSNFLFAGTIKENLTVFNKEATVKDLDYALEITGLTKEIKDLPQGLDTPLVDLGEGISVGQSQRLAIARALIASRPVLILDEATSALDSQTESLVLHNLKNLHKTIIFVTHRPLGLELADNSYKLEEGRLTKLK
ncbi:MAG: ABC transporter ATP-binding protein [Bacilli bacterium]|jgi:ATP-binding cassette subfamily B protein